MRAGEEETPGRQRDQQWWKEKEKKKKKRQHCIGAAIELTDHGQRRSLL